MEEVWLDTAVLQHCRARGEGLVVGRLRLVEEAGAAVLVADPMAVRVARGPRGRRVRRRLI